MASPAHDRYATWALRLRPPRPSRPAAVISTAPIPIRSAARSIELEPGRLRRKPCIDSPGNSRRRSAATRTAHLASADTRRGGLGSSYNWAARSCAWSWAWSWSWAWAWSWSWSRSRSRTWSGSRSWSGLLALGARRLFTGLRAHVGRRFGLLALGTRRLFTGLRAHVRDLASGVEDLLTLGPVRPGKVLTAERERRNDVPPSDPLVLHARDEDRAGVFPYVAHRTCQVDLDEPVWIGLRIGSVTELDPLA